LFRAAGPGLIHADSERTTAKESDMSTFWINWLRACSVFLMGYGVMMALAAFPPLDFAVHMMHELMLQPDAATAMSREAVFITSVAGAMLIGWGVMIYYLATYGLTSDAAPWARRAMVIGLVAWFVVDNIVSYAVGAYMNIPSNCVFGLLFALPLFMTRPRSDLQAA